jgi:hypothetical protein
MHMHYTHHLRVHQRGVHTYTLIRALKSLCPVGISRVTAEYNLAIVHKHMCYTMCTYTCQ